jgi:NADH-quinone oxidoreductase subunit L
MALVAVVIGVAIAIVKYRSEVPRVAPTNVRFFTKIARRDLLQDDFNEVVLMRPGQALTKFLVATDEKAIDGAVRTVGAAVIGSSKGIRKTQTGFVRSYALLILLGAFALLATIWVVTL